MDEFYKDKSNYFVEPDRAVVKAVFKHLPNSTDTKFNQVCWFHLTRTPETNKFEEGILPLGEAVDAIWNFLFSLLEARFSQQELSQFKNEVLDPKTSSKSHNVFLYHAKAGKNHTWGPYAMLVQEAAFRFKEIGNHDYLGVPETVQDICNHFAEKFNFNLLELFKRKTKPCIVKFISNEVRDEYLEIALYYLYTVYYNNKFSYLTSTNFDGKGKPVPPNRILKIEFLEDLE